VESERSRRAAAASSGSGAVISALIIGGVITRPWPRAVD
jgi:hypothetical protein